MSLVGEDFDRFEIQRKKEKHKGYDRLKKDIKSGALIPTITLAIEPEAVKNFAKSLAAKNRAEIIAQLAKHPDKIYILDGLQRTYIINDLKANEIIFDKNQKLLLEIWFETNISHLIYRLIVLNSGQKPMSMRHQIELLFITLRETLTQEISGLQLLQEKDEQKRLKPMEYPFERLVTAYKSYITKSPEIDKDNIVSEKMMESDILDSDEQFLSDWFLKFKTFLHAYTLLDKEAFRIYKNSNSYVNWLADANVINSFFAALGKFCLDEKRERIIRTALAKLQDDLASATINSDPFALEKFNEIKKVKADSKLYNVGFATRKLLTTAFIEFFRSEGALPLSECWIISSAEL
jgi:hypothetical protein